MVGAAERVPPYKPDRLSFRIWGRDYQTLTDGRSLLRGGAPAPVADETGFAALAGTLDEDAVAILRIQVEGLADDSLGRSGVGAAQLVHCDALWRAAAVVLDADVWVVDMDKSAPGGSTLRPLSGPLQLRMYRRSGRAGTRDPIVIAVYESRRVYRLRAADA